MIVNNIDTRDKFKQLSFSFLFFISLAISNINADPSVSLISNLSDNQTIPTQIYNENDPKDIGLAIVNRLREGGERSPVSEEDKEPFHSSDYEIRIYGKKRFSSQALEHGLLNYHQSDSSGGIPSGRFEREDTLAGIKFEEQNGLNPLANYSRPQYGAIFFSNSRNGREQPTHYGHVAAVLKKDINKRSTWLSEDSLVNKRLMPEALPLDGNWKGLPYEVQIFGSVDIRDIEYFIVPNDKPGVVNDLKRTGLPIYSYDSVSDKSSYRLASPKNDEAYEQFKKRFEDNHHARLTKLRDVSRDIDELLGMNLDGAEARAQNSSELKRISSNFSKWLNDPTISHEIHIALGSISNENPKALAALLTTPNSFLNSGMNSVSLTHLILTKDEKLGKRLIKELVDHSNKDWAGYLKMLVKRGDLFDLISDIVLDCVKTTGCRTDMSLFEEIVFGSVESYQIKKLDDSKVKRLIRKSALAKKNMDEPISVREAFSLMNRWSGLSNSDYGEKFSDYNLKNNFFEYVGADNREEGLKERLSFDIEEFFKLESNKEFFYKELAFYIRSTKSPLDKNRFFNSLDIPSVVNDPRGIALISEFADGELFDWGSIVLKYADLDNPLWRDKIDDLISKEISSGDILKLLANNIDHPSALGLIDRVVSGHSTRHVYYKMNKVIAEHEALRSHPRRDLWESALADEDKANRRELLNVEAVELKPKRTNIESGPVGELRFLESANGHSRPRWFVDENGTKWLLKADSIYPELQTSAEVISAGIYRRLGFNAPEAHIIMHEGSRYVAIKEIEGIDDLNTTLENFNNSDFRKARIVAAMLADWDRTRVGPNNFQTNDGGFAFFDFGGSLGSRARGEHKPGRVESDAIGSFSGNLSAAEIIESFRVTHLSDEHPWNKITIDDVKELVTIMEKELTDEFISQLVESAEYSSQSDERYMIHVLKSRRDVLIAELPEYASDHFNKSRVRSSSLKTKGACGRILSRLFSF